MKRQKNLNGLLLRTFDALTTNQMFSGQRFAILAMFKQKFSLNNIMVTKTKNGLKWAKTARIRPL